MLKHVTGGIHAAVKVLAWIGALAGAFMVIVIMINVFGRFLFRQPLRGTIELVELMTVVLIYSVLPYAEFRQRIIRVDLVVALFPRRAEAVLSGAMCLVGTVFFLTMSWEALELMWSNLFPSLVSTDTLSIPFAPFAFVIAIGSLLLGLEMLINAFQALSAKKRQGGE